MGNIQANDKQSKVGKSPGKGKQFIRNLNRKSPGRDSKKHGRKKSDAKRDAIDREFDKTPDSDMNEPIEASDSDMVECVFKTLGRGGESECASVQSEVTVSRRRSATRDEAAGGGGSTSGSVLTEPLTPQAVELNQCYYSAESDSAHDEPSQRSQPTTMPQDATSLLSPEKEEKTDAPNDSSDTGEDEKVMGALFSGLRTGEQLERSTHECHHEFRENRLKACPGQTSFTISRHRKVELPPVTCDTTLILDNTIEEKTSRTSSASDVPMLADSNVLRKVASLTLDQHSEVRVVRPKFVPEKMDFQNYEKFEGQMLLNWFQSSVSENNNLKHLSTQDLKSIGIQYCTHLLAAGVLRQIVDKGAPQENVFKPNLMYYWAHMEVPASQPVTPGRLHMPSAWPPDKETHQIYLDNQLSDDNYLNENNNEEITDLSEAKVIIRQLKRKIADLEYQIEKQKLTAQIEILNKNLEQGYDVSDVQISPKKSVLNKEVQTCDLDNTKPVINICENDPLRANVYNLGLSSVVKNEKQEAFPEKRSESVENYCKLNKSRDFIKGMENKLADLKLEDISRCDSERELCEEESETNSFRTTYESLSDRSLEALSSNFDGKSNITSKEGSEQKSLQLTGSTQILYTIVVAKHTSPEYLSTGNLVSKNDSKPTQTEIISDNFTSSVGSTNQSSLSKDSSKCLYASQNIDTSLGSSEIASKSITESTDTKQISTVSLSLPLKSQQSSPAASEPSPERMQPSPSLPVLKIAKSSTSSSSKEDSLSTEGKYSSSMSNECSQIPITDKIPSMPAMAETEVYTKSTQQKVPSLATEIVMPSSTPEMPPEIAESPMSSSMPESGLSTLPTKAIGPPPPPMPDLIPTPPPMPEIGLPPPPMPGTAPIPPQMPGMAPPPPPMPEMGPPPPPMPGMGPPPPPMPGMGPPPPPMPGMGPPPPPMPGMGPPPPPMPGMGSPPPPMPGMGPPPPPMPGMGPPPPPMPGMGPLPPPMPGMGPPPPPMPGMGPPPPPMPGMGPPPPPMPGIVPHATSSTKMVATASASGVGPPPPSLPTSDIPPPPPGGPVPFPAPPVGGWAMQRATLRKTPIKPAAPMKPLYWTRILAAPTEAVGPDESSNSKPLWLEIDETNLDNIDEFTDLFSRQVVKAPVKKKTETRKSKIQPVKILDSKRSQNVGILAQSLHVEFSEIENAIYNFDTSVVSLEALQQIYELRATEEELAAIKEHLKTKPEIPLDRPEAFLHDLSGISHFAERISCFMFQAEFEDAVNTAMHKLDNLKHTCEFLMTSKPLKNLFAIILTLGNYMNGGNGQRGQADGFGLEILAKLKDVKSKQSNVTLLHFIVRTYMRRAGGALAGECALPVPEPGDVARAAATDFADVRASLDACTMQLQACKQKTKKVIESDAQSSSPNEGPCNESNKRLEVFKEKMNTFINAAEEKLKAENENLEECRSKFIATVKFYQYRPKCGKIEECEPKEFFSLWTSFCTDFKDIFKKEEQLAIKEKLKEAKKMQEERKSVTQPKKEGGLKSRLQKLSSSRKS